MEEIEACIADPNTVEAEVEARELARITPQKVLKMSQTLRLKVLRKWTLMALILWANIYQLLCRMGIILGKQIFMKPQ